MNTGNNILTLRTERHMSQEELAELLSVSRQSISKWETNQSVPELDKLCKMSELFNVSLDTLIRGDTGKKTESADDTVKLCESQADIKPSYTDVSFSESPDNARLPVKKRHTTAGIVFIILSAISLILSFFKTGGFAPVTLMLSACFAVCAVLCFIRLKYTALKCAWVFYFALTVPTGLNSNVFGAVTFYLYKSEIRPGANTVFWNFAVLFLYLCVIFFSVLIMKRERIYITAKSLISLSLIYMLSWLLSNLAVLYNKSAGSVLQSLSSVLDIAFLILLSLMLIMGFRKKRKAL